MFLSNLKMVCLSLLKFDLSCCSLLLVNLDVGYVFPLCPFNCSYMYNCFELMLILCCSGSIISFIHNSRTCLAQSFDHFTIVQLPIRWHPPLWIGSYKTVETVFVDFLLEQKVERNIYNGNLKKWSVFIIRT